MVLVALVGSRSRPGSVGPGPPVMLGSDVTSHPDKDSIMAIRVFVVDDHELVREGLRAVLQRDGDIEVVGESAGASDGVRGIQATQPDVALIDVRLPDGDGLDVCRIVRRQAPGVACLLLTSHSNDELLFSAIRADAAGFCPAPPHSCCVRCVALLTASHCWTLRTTPTRRIRSGGNARERRRRASGDPQSAGTPAASPSGEGLTNRRVAQQNEPRREDGEELCLQSASEAGHV